MDEVMNYFFSSNWNLKGVQGASTLYSNVKGTYEAICKGEASADHHRVCCGSGDSSKVSTAILT
jgi:hypothetical protein